MISSILMKDCATYSSNGVLIDNCKKVNFFYGPNGSGKSTVGNFLSNQDDQQYSSCEIKWQNESAMNVVVYNREFRERHFREDIDGIFTLGEATIEDIDRIKELKQERDQKRRDLDAKKQALRKKQDEYRSCRSRHCDAAWTTILKKNEGDFQKVFCGLRSNKEKFMGEVVRRYGIDHSSSKTRDDLKERMAIVFSEDIEMCSPLPVLTDELVSSISEIESDQIWGRAIVGRKDVPIADLIESLGNADWVNNGRSYLHEDGVCPFCQQKTITESFRQQIELFFGGDYDAGTKRIEQLRSKYLDLSEQVIDSCWKVLLDENAVSIGGIDTSEYNSLLVNLQSKFAEVLTAMSLKKVEPGSKVSITGSFDKINEIQSVILAANTMIEKHNAMIRHKDEERLSLINDVWTFLTDEYHGLIEAYLKEMSNLSKALTSMQQGVNDCQRKLNDLNSEIAEAEKDITSAQPTVDEINRSLTAYGFTNFQIVPSPSKENCYQIQRLDGTLATSTLSEGEETFITFLYFFQLAKGSVEKSDVSTKKILVLDDPISSLDGTILYVVSSMVKSLIKDIRDGKSDVEQIFILTHNVFFHKETSFIDGRAKELNDVNYWIISKDNNVSSIHSYNKTNPIKTSYELLWQELRDNNSASLVTTQNVMRRIIENYFGILGKSVDDTIIDSLGSAEDRIIGRSLISWINDGSHSIPDDLYINSYSDSVDKYKSVFREIFVRMGHQAHYDMMMQVCDT